MPNQTAQAHNVPAGNDQIRTRPPWVREPYRLISWWDMEQFTAVAFYKMGNFLQGLKRNLEVIMNEEGYTRDTEIIYDSSNPTDPTVAYILNELKSECQKISLTVSVKCLDSLVEMRSRNYKLGHILDHVGQLEKTIMWEMEDKLFMFVPPDRAAFYDQAELFGEDVNAKFPTIQYDMVEAGNCYASGRSTAVVFHLMRVMETGVQQFGTKLGITLVHEKYWQNILDGINKAIKALPKSPTTVEMSEASANLYAVKLAWRNEVMHPKDTYTLEEADNLIRQVRIFMQQLAKIL